MAPNKREVTNPEETIRRRFVRSNSNFVTKYRKIVDHWVLLDAGDTPPSEVASWSSGSQIKEVQPGHAALRGLKGERECVQEDASEYAFENRFYTENLEDVIASVAAFLRKQEELDVSVGQDWIKSNHQFHEIVSKNRVRITQGIDNHSIEARK